MIPGRILFPTHLCKAEHGMQHLLSLIQQLISFPTLAERPDEIKRCTNFIRNLLKKNDVPHEVLHIEDSPSILVTPVPEKCPILLISHMDVVAGSDRLFVPRIEGGYLWGRGAVDDKYAIALSLFLLFKKRESLRKAGLDPQNLPFGLLITSDEESGGERGTAAILPRLSCDFAIVLDGGRPEEIVVRQKGILRLRLEVKGKSAHGARPWLGKNALEGLMEDLMRIRPLFDGKNSDHWEKTLNIGRMEGGRSVNQVPDQAFALLDIRFTEKENPAEIFEEMKRVLRHGALVQESLDPVFTAGASPYLDLLTQALPDIRLGQEHGASDAHYLSKNGIPGIVWGADGEMSQHSDEERLRLDSLAALLHHMQVFLDLCHERKGFLP